MLNPQAFYALLKSLLGPEAEDYLDQVGRGSSGTFRFNPLKHTLDFQALVLRRQGFEWRSLASRHHAMRIERRPFALGQSLSHVLGHIYIQDLASMVPVWALDPEPGDRILDMCAAPGSKTTQIAAAMENKGVLVANEISTRRMRVLIANLHRMGVVNTGVRRAFGEQYGNQCFQLFDRVLLDPPCTALGTVRKWPGVMARWTPEGSARLATVQKNLLLSGLKALKPGGILVYSTCTIAPDENEAVIDWALSHFPVELERVSIDDVGARPGLTSWQGTRFDSRLDRTLRLYPFENGSEGFFVARLRKMDSFSQGRSLRVGARWQIAESAVVDEGLDQLRERFQADFPFADYGYRQAGKLYITSREWLDFGSDTEIRTVGLPLAHSFRDQVRLTTEAAHLINEALSGSVIDLGAWDQLLDYCNRIDVDCLAPASRQVVARFEGQAIGHALVDQELLISRFPRIGWTFGSPP